MMRGSPRSAPARVFRIVVGVDGSPESHAALRWAISHAEGHRVAVRVVTAWSPVRGSTFDTVHPENDPVPLLAAETVLARAAAEAGVDVGDRTVGTARVPGHPAEVLVRESADADLLVVGTHGHGGIVGALRGSVSNYIAAHAACPVVLVRRPEGDPPVHHDGSDRTSDSTMWVEAGMRVGSGMPVEASDGWCGEVADVVVGPRRRVTHLVVRSGRGFGALRLVPVEAVASGTDRVVLSWSTARVGKAVGVDEVGVLHLGDWPRYRDGWDVGHVRGVTAPYDDVAAAGGSMLGPPLLWGGCPALSPVARFDRIPEGSAEVRHTSAVVSNDNHLVGQLGGLVLGADHAITGLIVDRGHLWARREIIIPGWAIASVATDLIRLRVTRADLGSFPTVRPPHHRTG